MCLVNVNSEGAMWAMYVRPFIFTCISVCMDVSLSLHLYMCGLCIYVPCKYQGHQILQNAEG